MASKPAVIMKRWASGDFIYAAVVDLFPPKNTAHMMINGREYPVAKMGTMGVDENDSFILFVDWFVSLEDRFPEPIKGWNT